MDMKEASAMTEASGVTHEHGGYRALVRSAPATAPVGLKDAAIRWAERLRELTVKAPL